MKKWIFMLFVIFTLFNCSMLPFAADPVEYLQYEDFYYYLNSDGSATISGWSGFETRISIPKEIDGHLVTTIGESAFSNEYALWSIEIPDTIKTIESFAFMNCVNLRSFEIPDSVNEIQDGVFCECKNFKEIVVSKGNDRFSVDDGVLFDTKENRLICFPTKLKRKKYCIPDGTSSISTCAFSECLYMETVEIPESVISIGLAPFYYCPKLKDIKISPENGYYAVIEHVLFDKENKSIICYPANLDSKDYTIPAGITNIGYAAFGGCKYIESIVIPGTVSDIETEAFCRCSNLLRVSIPETVTTIQFGTFSRCSKLQDVEIPTSVDSIGDVAFYNCKNLCMLRIPKSVKNIGEAVFEGCHNLKLIVEHGSYIATYAKNNNLTYEYVDANDWLTD